jgi:tetratricopeptide (TPR) repeat protein
MATDSIMGLFQTPEQYQLAQQQAQMEQARTFAAQDPMQRAVASQYFAGGQLGRALGGEDPMLKMQSMRAQIMRQVDQTDPQSLAKAAQALNQAGDVQGARALAQAAQDLELKQSQVTRNLREPRMAALPNIAKLQQYRKQAEEAGASPQELAQIDAVIKAEGQGKGTNISVGLSTVDKESNLRKDFTTETKPLTTVITTADRIGKLLEGNTSLGEVIARKQFAKLAGDTNISNRDVADLANFGDLGQRLSGILSGFFEGKYSEAQRQEAINLVKQLRAESSNQYKTVQQQYRDRAAAENIPEKTGTFIAPDLPVSQKAALPPEGTKLRNKKTGKIEVVRNGKLVPAE